jgi:threonyl-tRNA synthetase
LFRWLPHRVPQSGTGNFPLWLAPDQVRVITLNDDEALINYAQPVVAELRVNMVRGDADFSAPPFKAKISNAEQSAKPCADKTGLRYEVVTQVAAVLPALPECG